VVRRCTRFHCRFAPENRIRLRWNGACIEAFRGALGWVQAAGAKKAPAEVDKLLQPLVVMAYTAVVPLKFEGFPWEDACA